MSDDRLRYELTATTANLRAAANRSAAHAAGEDKDATHVESWSRAAKVALEAAALAADAVPAGLDEQLAQVRDELALSHVPVAGDDTAAVIAAVVQHLQQDRANLDWLKGLAIAYEQLDTLLEGLLKEFTDAETEPSMRLARRIMPVLDDSRDLATRGLAAARGAGDGSTDDPGPLPTT